MEFKGLNKETIETLTQLLDNVVKLYELYDKAKHDSKITTHSRMHSIFSRIQDDISTYGDYTFILYKSGVITDDEYNALDLQHAPSSVTDVYQRISILNCILLGRRDDKKD